MEIFDRLEEFVSMVTSLQSSKTMYPPELEKLIDIAISDGIITDTERRVLHKKASKFDIDPDELDMVLESRLGSGQATNSAVKNESGQSKSLKSKRLKKCPMCGAVINDPNTVHCSYCGTKVVNIVKDILEEINSVVPSKRAKQDFGVLGKVVDFIDYIDGDSDFIRQKENIILSYHIPVVKEVILEFLAFSVQKGSKKGYESGYWTDDLGEAWYKKSEQIIGEARRIFSQDSEFMTILKDYAVRLGMEKRGVFRR